jgi:hypothetical protein
MVARVRRTYTVTAERAAAWWAITVDELPGVFSQARRLDRVEAMAREAIRLFLSVPHDSFDLIVCEKLTLDAQQAVTEVFEARAKAIAGQQVASERSRVAVRTLADLGLPQRDIGRLLDLSHQRVAQLLGTARGSGG